MPIDISQAPAFPRFHARLVYLCAVRVIVYANNDSALGIDNLPMIAFDVHHRASHQLLFDYWPIPKALTIVRYAKELSTERVEILIHWGVGVDHCFFSGGFFFRTQRAAYSLN